MVPMRGFTLLEVVISIFVVGVAATLAASLLQVVPLARHTKHEDVALKIAAHEIEAVRVLGYDALPASGPVANPLLAELPAGAGELEVSDYNANTKQVAASISWTDPGAATSTVTLVTLITSIGGLR